MKIEHIPFDEEIKRFDEHLKDPENERTILSGIFGIGKTYFIHDYFKVNEDIYDVIIISPVNYSVSSNEDIFELIKFDILFQLLGKKIDYENFQLDYLNSADLYLKENYKNILLEFAKGIPKVGRNIFDMALPIKGLIELFEKPLENTIKGVKKTKEKSKIDDKEEAAEFLKFLANIKGTPVELNMTSQLINKLLQSQSEEENNNSERKFVLVIDDIDRVDPEHIFRIFNVFSAHFDYYGYSGQNKFEFDKVILVCDIKNIKSVFCHRYGENADFSGYIDKFYSNEIFHYDFARRIEDNVTYFLSRISTNNKILKDALEVRGSMIKTDLTMVLGDMVLSGSLSLRSILKFLNTNLLFPDKTIRLRGQNIYLFSIPIFIEIYLLNKLLDGKENLLKALNLLVSFKPAHKLHGGNNFVDKRIGSLIQLVDYKNNHLEQKDELITYESTEHGFKATYGIYPISAGYGSYGKIKDITFINQPTYENAPDTVLVKEFIFPMYQLFKLAATNYYQLVSAAE